MSRAVAILTLLAAGLAIAAPPPKNDPPWLIARLGNNRFRQSDAVSALTYSPDGKHLASADGETIHIWDASDGRRVRSIPIDDHSFFALRYTSDGRTLLAAGIDDRSTRLIKIDPTTGKVRANVAVRAGKAEGIFSDDGNWLALLRVVEPVSFRPDRLESLVHVFNVVTGNDWTTKIDGAQIWSMAIKRDGSAIAVGTNEQRLHIFESRSGRLLDLFSIMGVPKEIDFSPDGKTLVAAMMNNSRTRIASIDATNGKESWSHSVDSVFRVRFAEDGKKVVLFGAEEHSRHLACWYWLDAKTGSPTGEMLDSAMERTHSSETIAWSGNQRTLCQGTFEGRISQWDFQARQRLTSSCDPPVAVREMALVASQSKVRGWSRGWYEWDVKTGKQTRLTPPIDLGMSEDFAASSDGVWLVYPVRKSGSFGTEYELKNLKTGKIHMTREFVGSPEQLQFLPDGHLAAITHYRTMVFDPASGKKKVDIEGSGLRITTDGKSVVQVTRDESRVRLVRWNLDDGSMVSDWTGEVTELGDGHRQVGLQTCFSADGRLVALQSERMTSPNVMETRTVLLDTSNGHRIADWNGGPSSSGIRFTPDGRSILEYNLKPFSYFLRETATGGYRAQVLYRGTSVNDFAFSPDARKLIVSTQPYPIEIWDVIRASGQWDAMKPDALWAALAGKESEHAYKSIRHLLMHPGKAVSFLKERVKVPESPSAEWVKERLKGLDAAQFRDREKATADLAAVGELVLPALREAAKAASEEAQSRLKPLIEKALALTTEKLRAIRACEVLEGLGTPEALTLLEAWARGAPGATLTREARESVERIRISKK